MAKVPTEAPGAGHVTSLRELKKADTRTRLSVAAVELLVAQGAEGTTVSAIANRAGVSTRTFHNYFAHREDAFLYFIREQVSQWARQVDDAPSETPALRVLHGILRKAYTRPETDIVAAGNLVVLGQRIGVLLGPEGQPDIEEILGPLYDSVRRRAATGTEFRTRLLVDLSLAAAGAALRQHSGQQAGQRSGHDAIGRPGGGPSLAGLLDEAFEALERGIGT